MENLTFHGTDSSLEISLLEYGLIMSDQKHKDNSGTQFVVYQISKDAFGCGHFSEQETNSYIEGKQFMDKNDIKNFLSFVGSSKKEWLKSSHVNKLQDLISYYGTDNICGTDYYPMSENEVIERYLKK